MQKLLCATALLTFAVFAHAANDGLITEDCDFGEKYAFSAAECELTLSNTGAQEIELSDFVAARPGDRIDPSHIKLAPHSKAYVKARLAIGNEIGSVRHGFSFRTADKRLHSITARGFVNSVLDQGRPIIDFGVVDLSKDPLPEREVDLSSAETPNFRVEKIIEVPSYLDAQIAKNGTSVKIKFRRQAPWGYRGDWVKLRVNSEPQNEVWVGVQSDIHGDVIPSANPYNLGLVREGSSNEQKIRLTEREGKDFRIGAIRTEGAQFDTDTEQCQPAAAGCRLIRLRINGRQPFGSLVGKIYIELPEYSQNLLLAINGLYVAKDTRVDKVDAADLAAQNQKSASRDASAVDLANAIKGAVHEEREQDQVPPTGNGPLLKWLVSNDSTVHGYQIFRSDTETGPFVLLNRTTLPAKRIGQATPSNYQYRDNTAQSGRTYWYYIGIVYNDGRKQQLTGPQEVVAK